MKLKKYTIDGRPRCQTWVRDKKNRGVKQCDNPAKYSPRPVKPTKCGVHKTHW